MYFMRINSIAKAAMKFSKILLKHKVHLPLSLMVSFVHCSGHEIRRNPIQFTDPIILTHEHLIKQACSVSVNSATQLLTQTLVALIDTGDEYRKAMEELLRLLDESMERTIHNVDQSELNDLLVATRSRVAELNRSFLQLNSLMEYVEKYVQSTAEAAFIAGAETVCNAMSDRLHAAQQELSLAKEKNKKLEDDCLKIQKALVKAEETRRKNKQNSNID